MLTHQAIFFPRRARRITNPLALFPRSLSLSYQSPSRCHSSPLRTAGNFCPIARRLGPFSFLSSSSPLVVRERRMLLLLLLLLTSRGCCARANERHHLLINQLQSKCSSAEGERGFREAYLRCPPVPVTFVSNCSPVAPRPAASRGINHRTTAPACIFI